MIYLILGGSAFALGYIVGYLVLLNRFSRWRERGFFIPGPKS